MPLLLLLLAGGAAAVYIASRKSAPLTPPPPASKLPQLGDVQELSRDDKVKLFRTLPKREVEKGTMDANSQILSLLPEGEKGKEFERGAAVDTIYGANVVLGQAILIDSGLLSAKRIIMVPRKGLEETYAMHGSSWAIFLRPEEAMEIGKLAGVPIPYHISQMPKGGVAPQAAPPDKSLIDKAGELLGGTGGDKLSFDDPYTYGSEGSASPSDGSASPSVSANPDAGVSIGRFTQMKSTSAPAPFFMPLKLELPDPAIANLGWMELPNNLWMADAKRTMGEAQIAYSDNQEGKGPGVDQAHLDALKNYAAALRKGGYLLAASQFEGFLRLHGISV